ncbi:MAG: cell division protein FtsA, partial [Pseudomonadota bacterium]|nr:cell division protein FtsA [Pseudomonadota bacterium]MEC9459024.1 cell division protein FtsA [Pseudomonadota bacterium]MEC9481171.1 cell division protein FtsA [Pseudomonadota bacterium]
MTKNDKQQDLFARQRKGNQTKEILTSIDIGSDKIVCLIAKSDQVTREKRAIRVIGSGYCQSKGIRNGRIFDANEAEKSIRLALDKAEKTANIEVNSINLCISGDFIDSHIMKGNINISENAIN